MRLVRLDHLVLVVQKLQDAADAWERTFGLRAEAPFTPEGSRLELAVLPLDDRAEGGAFLELVQPAEEDHRLARHLEQWGEGMFSISIEVDDLDAAVRELRAKGVTVSGPPALSNVEGPALSNVEGEEGVLPNTRVARVPGTSAHGVAIQLIERPTTS